jgi:hypothetical protein
MRASAASLPPITFSMPFFFLLSPENAPQILLDPPLRKGDFTVPLFGKEGLGEIFRGSLPPQRSARYGK